LIVAGQQYHASASETVIPAQAGIQPFALIFWIPACAGMTRYPDFAVLLKKWRRHHTPCRWIAASAGELVMPLLSLA